jgi:hypothetical protein
MSAHGGVSESELKHLANGTYVELTDDDEEFGGSRRSPSPCLSASPARSSRQESGPLTADSADAGAGAAVSPRLGTAKHGAATKKRKKRKSAALLQKDAPREESSIGERGATKKLKKRKSVALLQKDAPQEKISLGDRRAWREARCAANPSSSTAALRKETKPDRGDDATWKGVIPAWKKTKPYNGGDGEMLAGRAARFAVLAGPV